MKKIISLVIVVVCMLSLTACKNKIETIKIVEDSVPAVININDVDSAIASIKLEVTKSKGEVEIINLEKSMISEEDYKKLSNAGYYTITINYEDFKASLTLTIDDPNAYSVKVVYPDGKPVTSGVSVQWCTGNTCLRPVEVNGAGIAYSNLGDTNNYYIHIDGIPQGYTYDPNAYTTNKDNKKVEISLIPLNELTGLGTVDNPYIVSENASSVSFETQSVLGVKYFSFTPSVAGTYSIKSLAMDKLALNAIDPYIGFLGANATGLENADVSANYDKNYKEVINFNHTFTAEANVTYMFIIFVSSADSYPASFDIVITK